MVDQKTVSEEDTFGVEKPNIKGEEEEKDPEEVDEPVKNAGDDEEIRRKIEELRIGDGKSDEEDGEEESETEEDGEDGDEKEKKVESQLIERGPVRWRDEKTQFHQLPYYYQQIYEPPKPEPQKHIPACSVHPDDVVDETIVPRLTDTQILNIALTDEFRDFVELAAQMTPIAAKPRRESADSSYFSDNPSPDPAYSPATPPSGQKTAKEAFRATLNEAAKLKRWVQWNTMDDERLFGVDEEGQSELHRLLKENEPDLRESFYSLVEAMACRSKREFRTLIAKEPRVRAILEENHPDFLDYFREVEMTLA